MIDCKDCITDGPLILHCGSCKERLERADNDPEWVNKLKEDRKRLFEESKIVIDPNKCKESH